MKSVVKIFILAFIANALLSCDTDTLPEVKNTTTIKAKIEYMANPEVRYRIEFGRIQLADSLPRIDKLTGTTSATSPDSNISLNGLTDVLKVWRLLADGSQRLEIETMVNTTKKGTISLLQLADDKPILYFKPLYPPEGANQQTVIQFLYNNPAQPERVEVSILGIDYYSLLSAGNNIEKVPSGMKDVIAEFEIKRGQVSTSVIADLGMYNGINNNLPAYFFYKISNPETGQIIQDYSIDNKIMIQTKPDSRINAKYKFTLFEWRYQSQDMPFKRPHSIIIGEQW